MIAESVYFFLSVMSAVVILRYEQGGELSLRRKLQDAGEKKKETLIQHLSSFLVTNKGSRWCEILTTKLNTCEHVYALKMFIHIYNVIFAHALVIQVCN